MVMKAADRDPRDLDDEALACGLAAKRQGVDSAKRQLGDYIQAARERGWTQERIAEALGVSQPNVSKYLARHQSTSE